MTRRAKFHPWQAQLDAAQVPDAAEIWEGWVADRDMTHAQALEAAREDMVAALGHEFAHLAQYVVVK